MTKQHFFKPLLPGFHTHMTIPVAFFSKYIEGRSEHKTTAKLRSDASKIIWEVKIEDGQKLTDGWKEFALAHDLRIGDILIFRQEKDMSFHVTLFGPSCCEIQYESCLDNQNNLGKIPEKKKVKKKPRKETVSSALDASCFVANVSPSTLRYDTLYFRKSFVRANGIVTGCGEIVLMNEKGRSWTLNLRQKKSCGTMYITRGWRSFCRNNGVKAGDSITFKLIQGGRTLVLRLSTTESEEEESSEGDEESNLEKSHRKKKVKMNPKRVTESSSLDPSCFVANISASALHNDTLCLPKKFAWDNGLDTRCGEIVLMNEKGTSWTLNLRLKKSCGTMYITRGWRSFCSANGLRAGSFCTFKLILRGRTLVLRLSPTESEEEEEEEEEEESSEDDKVESFSTEPESNEESNQDDKSFKRPRLIWKASSSPSQNRFVTLNLKPFNLAKSILFLPVPFTRMHGINEETKMTLLDKHGVKWSTDLRSENRGDRIRLVGGWKEFFKVNCVEIGESIMLKLIWEGDTSCVLKFCSKCVEAERFRGFENMATQHFFKPLLPGFHRHLTIPEAFFLRHMDRECEQKTMELRSDASKIIWQVKIEDGQILTDGWKEFALAHDLRIGDILIFRQEKDMSFHVTLFGPSFCEIRYESCLDEENNLGKVPEKKKVKKHPRKEAGSSSLDPSCFVANVSRSTLRYDTLCLPRSFVRANGLDTRCGEIILMNSKGTSWTLHLRQKKSCGTMYIIRGWRIFCRNNGLKAGDSTTFKLIQGGRTLALRLSTTKSEEEESNLEKIHKKKKVKMYPKRVTKSSSLDPSCFVANVSPSALRDDSLNLPSNFVRANGLDTRLGEIVLMNEKGTSWTLALKQRQSGTTYIRRGWRRFCSANGLKVGDSFTFKLIQRGGTLVLSLCPVESEEESSEGDEVESLSTEPESDEESNQDEKSFKKPRSLLKASSSPSRNRFVTLTLRPFNLKKYTMYLPARFTRMHGINEETKMSLLDKHGFKWSTDLRSENTSDRIRMVTGWKEFFKASCVEIGESIMLELIWEGDTSCVLKFCSKVEQETN